MINAKHIRADRPMYFLNHSYMINNLYFYVKMSRDKGRVKSSDFDKGLWFLYQNRKYFIELLDGEYLIYYYQSKNMANFDEKPICYYQHKVRVNLLPNNQHHLKLILKISESIKNRR